MNRKVLLQFIVTVKVEKNFKSVFVKPLKLDTNGIGEKDFCKRSVRYLKMGKSVPLEVWRLSPDFFSVR